ncbi:TPA: metallo-dependent hydrolase [Salmonella enterica subsp. enterica serovar Ball]|uniref:metallo-dependent hydrolase n=1 Tax=Salmonella enterica TaxID=28901 RepID=UPI001078BD2F|nr:metallo-dependent hydrolase [Salmonella enterica]EAB9747662.1 metallo-dependent hydrolase [Salmonella enterica subsp. salamae]EJU7770479.1 metallo-dependent hydrolase [Salmonella enterica subsp. salamae serovar 4,12:e,n,x:1,6]HCA3432647.1 metallo-dependent hydrolase [Salmonella enterica subsp. enterica serovar Ball]EAO6405837.1 metallo-dependent hydrolase [Salmonella enterica]ECD9608010.1 metallo-dependent hydrolase [Salmonella enterica subsp. salamae]
MKLDILIKNGLIADTGSNDYINRNIGIIGNRIVDLHTVDATQAETVIDAAGCIVLPGLIDFHAHVFHGGTAIGVNPDVICLPNGVTSVVDAGSSGWVNYPLFRNTVTTPAMVKIKSYLNVVNVGLSTLGGGPTGYLENTNPANYNVEKIAQTLRDNKDNILGLKLRYSQDIAKGKSYSSDPFLSTVALARELETSLCVHVTDSILPADKLINHFQTNDIYAHCFHGTGHSILNEQGELYCAIKDAQSRGVIFDCSNGVAHFDFHVAQTAMEQGFYPDIISTDLTLRNSLRTDKVFSLLHVMSKYLNMGMSFFDVIRAVTTTPARLMKMEGQIGTLAPGAFADISIVKLRKESITFEDTRGVKVIGDHYIDNCATLCNGQIVYRRLVF